MIGLFVLINVVQSMTGMTIPNNMKNVPFTKLTKNNINFSNKFNEKITASTTTLKNTNDAVTNSTVSRNVGRETISSQFSSVSGNVKSPYINSTNSSTTSSGGISNSTQTVVINLGDSTKKNEVSLATTLHFVEGFALVLLCNYRPFLRKLAAMILKEIKNLMKSLCIPEIEPPVIDVIDKNIPQVKNTLKNLVIHSKKNCPKIKETCIYHF